LIESTGITIFGEGDCGTVSAIACVHMP